MIDGPSQRLYVTAVYLALFAYRLYDWSKLIEDEADSFWLFMKWVAFDGVFFYGLPELHVPWLEWSSTTTTILFLVHAALNGMLMFRIPVRGPCETYFRVDPNIYSYHSKRYLVFW